MTTLYKLLLDATGMSQAEAADLHGKSLSTIKSWCSGARNAPEKATNELVRIGEKQRQDAQSYVDGISRNAGIKYKCLSQLADPSRYEDAGYNSPGAYLGFLRMLAVRRPDLFTQPSATREP